MLTQDACRGTDRTGAGKYPLPERECMLLGLRAPHSRLLPGSGGFENDDSLPRV